MKLFCDDLRRCPEGWTLARTNTEAIRLLASGFVIEISIDHDICTPFSGDISEPVRRRLQIGQETFQPVAYYIAAMPKDMRPEKITFHTANPKGAEKMMGILKDAGIESEYNESSYNINWDEIENEKEHDGNKAHCGCDCKGCLGLIPGTEMYKIGHQEFEGEF